jgi:hypothetical protein
MGKWANYLGVLDKQGRDWTNPDNLIALAKKNLVQITRKAAQQVIDRRITDLDNAAELEIAKDEWENINDGNEN